MPLICGFIASRRQEYGVAPICRALSVLGVPIAPRTYRAHLTRAPDLVNRQFHAAAPGLLHVADFTYMPWPAVGSATPHSSSTPTPA